MPYWNLEKRREYARLWMRRHRKNNPEKCKAIRKAWVGENKKRILEVKRTWRLANPEKIKEQTRRAIIRHREHYRAHREEEHVKARIKYHRNKADIAARGREVRLALRIEAINTYGNVCDLCGESDYGRLTLDHMNGDGKEFRRPFQECGLRMSGHHFYRWLKKRGFPKNLSLRVLCLSCNSREGIKRRLAKSA